MKVRILVLEKNIHCSKTIYTYLSAKNKDVYMAKTGNEALRIIEYEKIYLILTDVFLPDMPASKLLKKVKEINPDTVFIVMVERNETSHAIEFIKKGGRDCLLKPVNLEKLFVSVETCLLTKQLSNELLEANENLNKKNLQLEKEIKKRKNFEKILNKLNSELEASNIEKIFELEKKGIQLEKAKNEAESANKTKDIFLKNMSHALRTPLNGILGYTQILLTDKNLPEKQLEAIKIIQSSGEQLLLIINDILTISKMQADKIKLENKDFNFVEFLKLISDLLKTMTKEKELKFKFQVSNNLAQLVHGDEKRLRHVLLNLLNNAVKFTKEGEITFTVEQKGTKFLFAVEDTGIGIPGNEQNKIFKPFFQIQNNLCEAEGTGLGLSICKEIVELMGSKINVISRENKGTKFWFEIELKIIKGKQSEKKLEILNTTKKHRVLIVDDNEVNLEFLKHMLLQSSEFEVIKAFNGREALEKAIDFLPDIILMDIEMPIISGFEATRSIKKNPDLRHIPIIAVSAHAGQDIRNQAREAGYDEFIEMPYNIENILKIVKKFILFKTEENPVNIQECFNLPGEEDLNKLKKLVQTGNVMGIRKTINEIDDPNCKDFLEKVDQLAKNFKINELKEFILNCAG